MSDKLHSLLADVEEHDPQLAGMIRDELERKHVALKPIEGIQLQSHNGLLYVEKENGELAIAMDFAASLANACISRGYDPTDVAVPFLVDSSRPDEELRLCRTTGGWRFYYLEPEQIKPRPMEEHVLGLASSQSNRVSGACSECGRVVRMAEILQVHNVAMGPYCLPCAQTIGPAIADGSKQGIAFLEAALAWKKEAMQKGDVCLSGVALDYDEELDFQDDDD